MVQFQCTLNAYSSVQFAPSGYTVGSLISEMFTYVGQCISALWHSWRTSTISNALTTFTSTTKQLKSVHTAPGLQSATERRRTKHCHACAKSKRAMEYDKSS